MYLPLTLSVPLNLSLLQFAMSYSNFKSTSTNIHRQSMVQLIRTWSNTYVVLKLRYRTWLRRVAGMWYFICPLVVHVRSSRGLLRREIWVDGKFPVPGLDLQIMASDAENRER